MAIQPARLVDTGSVPAARELHELLSESSPPNQLWGTTPPMAYTAADGWVWALSATAEN